MITVNLLPTSRKVLLSQEKRYALIVRATLSLFTMLTLLTIPLLMGRVILKNKFISTVLETTRVTAIPKSGSYDIKDINKKIKAISVIQGEFVPWAKLFVVLSEKTPEGVFLSSVEINQDTKTLSITGFAANRASFLDFKNSLENDPLFTNIESPVGNILKQKDIDFTLRITLNTEVL